MGINKAGAGHKLTVNEVILCLIVFIIAGFGFISMHSEGIDVIEKSEAAEITASFEAYTYSYAKSGAVHDLVLKFSDAPDMTVDDSLASWELIDIIREIPKGTPVHMLIDESRNLILKLRTDDRVLISFEDAVYSIRSDKTGLAVLGIITIAGGMFLLVYIVRKKRKGLREQNLINNMINPV